MVTKRLCRSAREPRRVQLDVACATTRCEHPCRERVARDASAHDRNTLKVWSYGAPRCVPRQRACATPTAPYLRSLNGSSTRHRTPAPHVGATAFVTRKSSAGTARGPAPRGKHNKTAIQAAQRAALATSPLTEWKLEQYLCSVGTQCTVHIGCRTAVACGATQPHPPSQRTAPPAHSASLAAGASVRAGGENTRTGAQRARHGTASAGHGHAPAAPHVRSRRRLSGPP
jgi:hypothetical protein